MSIPVLHDASLDPFATGKDPTHGSPTFYKIDANAVALTSEDGAMPEFFQSRHEEVLHGHAPRRA